MLVEDVMTTSVETVDVDTSLADALDRMLAARVGSLVVTTGSPPRKVGIVTDRDVKTALRDVEHPLKDASFFDRLAFLLKRPVTGIPVSEHMSSPLVTTEPSETLSNAVKKMSEHDVDHLVVSKQLALEGILTPFDVTNAHDDIVSEARRSEVRRPYWQSHESERTPYGRSEDADRPSYGPSRAFYGPSRAPNRGPHEPSEAPD